MARIAELELDSGHFGPVLLQDLDLATPKKPLQLPL